ncbi:hypothetical protein [Microbacterium kunmingense]|uniref:hypothetical protein n=1 Tax=Microbacterium kunmingense TaxID=2915939 RepID=UPI0020037A01|nr:hypothetical protein [Microbacterium kunmingense]
MIKKVDVTTEGYITVAFGNPYYVRIARNLARSIRLLSPGRPIALVTDLLDEDLQDFDIVIPLDATHGPSLYHKLLLDEYSPFERTMFVDSDCLVTRSLDDIWSRFRGHEFIVVGGQHYAGSWFGGDIAALRERCGIEGPMSKFNSGFIYWERGPVSASVFNNARTFWGEYGNLGFGDFRAEIPVADEPLLSLGMAKSHVDADPDDGTVMCTPIGLSGRMVISLPRRLAKFQKNGRPVAPGIAHFCGYYRRGPSYTRASVWLALVSRERRITAWLAHVALYPLTLLDNSATWRILRNAGRASRGS